MAATRLIPLHVNKGKTIAQCLADRTDYSENEKKTENGKYISFYECDPKSCDQEFLLAKRQYFQKEGFEYKGNIIAYQIRQSFKPGEVTPEEANRVGYETAMRWTKGSVRDTAGGSLKPTEKSFSFIRQQKSFSILRTSQNSRK